jgi:hypothetical protein
MVDHGDDHRAWFDSHLLSYPASPTAEAGVMTASVLSERRFVFMDAAKLALMSMQDTIRIGY